MTVWYAGGMKTVFIPSCIPDSRPYRMKIPGVAQVRYFHLTMGT